MGNTVDAIKDAYTAAMRRLSALESGEFRREVLALDWSNVSRDVSLGAGLLRLAQQGSFDAAAALNVLAATWVNDEAEQLATDALAAIFRRNAAAKDELATDALVGLLEEAAAEMGMISRIDPVTGQRLWSMP